MYVCVCHAVTERDIRSAVAHGASSIENLQHRLGLATNCSACLEDAQDCLSKELDSRSRTKQKVAA